MSYDERDGHLGPPWGDEADDPRFQAMHWRMRRDLERADDNAHLRDHLTETEQIRLATRQHVIVLWKPVVAVTLALALFLRSIVEGDSLGSTQSFLFWLLVVAVLWLGWRILYWSRNLFVATDRRVLKVYGVLTTTVDSMRNQKVTDMRYRRDFFGELLGYGGIVIESAGQDQTLHDITFLPYPRENYQELCHVIFGEAPRSGGKKKNRFRRGLERMARRERTPATDYPDHDDLSHDHLNRDHLNRDYLNRDYPDHGDLGGEPREVVEDEPRREDSHQRMLYSSQDRHNAPTGPIPIYPPGFFGGRGHGQGGVDEDPTRP
jgi:hypothetical protein